MKEIIIIDYEGSNLFSVKRALEHLDLQVKVTSDPKLVRDAEAAILPGVGAFGAAMERLHALGLVDAIHSLIQAERPLLGICLGMQLLFSTSEEFGQQTGLNIIEGAVKRFPNADKTGRRVRVPQIGWNTISRAPSHATWAGTPMAEVPEKSFMYFVHSFYCTPADSRVSVSVTDYAGLTYSSSVRKGSVFAAQFHPEKSAGLGLSIYKNWAKLAGLLS
jgi:glutamine amidotransferase